MTGSSQRTIRVLLAGVHGHGRHHLANIRRMAGGGSGPAGTGVEPAGAVERAARVEPAGAGGVEPAARVELAGICDPRPLAGDLAVLAGPVPVAGSLEESLATVEPDVTVIATPIHTHVDLALTALRAGSHVLLEKPPAPDLAGYQRLLRGVRDSGKACQVGFQSLGSQALAAARRLVADGAIGEVTGIGAAGAWARDASYYARAPWAGRRRLDGVPVTDGVLTNPFAHAVISALALDGTEWEAAVPGIEIELYRAYEIDADDTSSIRLTSTRGTTIAVAATLCAEQPTEPYVRVHGSRGRITLWYTRDELRLENSQGARTTTWPRSDLLENLITHLRDPGTALLVPPERAGGFMTVAAAIGGAADPVPIAGRYQRVEGPAASARRTVPGVDEAVDAAAAGLRLFSELGLPWARPAQAGRTAGPGSGFAADSGRTAGPGSGFAADSGRTAGAAGTGVSAGAALATLVAGGTMVARYADGDGLDPRLSPRPYLHPVATLGGVVVTGCQPGDHPWHLGASVAIADVADVNFWGGRTYVPGRGYVWRDDHGTIRHRRWTGMAADGFSEELAWCGPDGRVLLAESRTVSASLVPGRDCWVLGLRFTLRNVTGGPLALGSPATKGRTGAGYGGFFWRLPRPRREARVRTAEADTEAAVHGSRAPWVAFSVDAGEPAGSCTLVFEADPDAADRWFVRAAEYPGVCPALAFSEPVRLSPGEAVARRFRVFVADGTLEPGDITGLIAGA